MQHERFIALIFLALFFALFTTVSLSAQETGAKREIGLQFSSLDFDGTTFSAFFKKQKKENVYRRIRLLYGNLLAGVANEDFAFDLSAGIAIGREKRKSLDEKLAFYQGPEFSLGLGLTSFSDDDLGFTVAPGFGWVVGIQHQFNDKWAINLETIPSVSVAARSDDAEGVLFQAELSNHVSLGLVRRF